MTIRKVILFFVTCLVSLNIVAADRYCNNLAFELGSFTNWQGFTWINSTQDDIQSTSPAPGFGMHTIMEDTTAYDSKTNYKLKKIPPGYRYSARLGDVTANTTAQTLRYTLLVDSQNCFLTYKFAVVLLNPLDGHSVYEEPRFKVTLFDQSGAEIPDCSNYDVYASDAELNSSFNVYQPDGSNSPVLWRDWTTVGANLMPYIGQQVSIEFMSSDCTHKGHYGYAYLVAECQPLQISVDFCSNDTNAVLTAPDGFETYGWVNARDSVLGTAKSLTVHSPSEGAVYFCRMESATGCTVSLQAVVERFDPQPDFSTAMVDCHSNEVQFSNTSTATKGSLEYHWDFGDGTQSTEQHPRHQFLSSGLHQVTLELSNPPSVCSVKLTKTVESFSPPLVGISGDSSYCPDQPLVLRAYGAYSYEWSNGSHADSVIVDPRDAQLWMLGKSSTGCISDTVYQYITAAPDWTLTLDAQAFFCAGASVFVNAAGAETYRWNTDETTPGITVNQGGTYTLTAANKRGCVQTKTIQVSEVALPDADFEIQSLTIDEKNSTLNCYVIHPDQAVQYDWVFDEKNNMVTETGSRVAHRYTDIDLSALYQITLTATNVNGCKSSVTKSVEAVPFYPNVFTPNGDGKNELFAAGQPAQIIDRYGKVLFDGATGWDGTYHGKPVPPDAYFYFVSYTDYRGQVQTRKGTVTLLR